MEKYDTKMNYDECLWYNGETSCYELLDFNPGGLSREVTADESWKLLKKKYGVDDEHKGKVLSTLYLRYTDNLERVI